MTTFTYKSLGPPRGVLYLFFFGPKMMGAAGPQVMQKNSLQWMELFLHFADVSNPLKPFPVRDAQGLRVWNHQEGDESKIEKKMGQISIVVGGAGWLPLNFL